MWPAGREFDTLALEDLMALMALWKHRRTHCSWWLIHFPSVWHFNQLWQRPDSAGGTGRGPGVTRSAGRNSRKKPGALKQAGDPGRQWRWGTAKCASSSQACLLSAGGSLQPGWKALCVLTRESRVWLTQFHGDLLMIKAVPVASATKCDSL